jgi:hypothetical protein
MKLMAIRTAFIGKRGRRCKYFGRIRRVREVVISPGCRIAIRSRRVFHGDLEADPSAIENAAGQHIRRRLLGRLEDLHGQNGPLRELTIRQEIIVCRFADEDVVKLLSGWSRWRRRCCGRGFRRVRQAKIRADENPCLEATRQNKVATGCIFRVVSALRSGGRSGTCKSKTKGRQGKRGSCQVRSHFVPRKTMNSAGAAPHVEGPAGHTPRMGMTRSLASQLLERPTPCGCSTRSDFRHRHSPLFVQPAHK